MIQRASRVTQRSHSVRAATVDRRAQPSFYPHPIPHPQYDTNTISSSSPQKHKKENKEGCSPSSPSRGNPVTRQTLEAPTLHPFSAALQSPSYREAHHAQGHVAPSPVHAATTPRGACPSPRDCHSEATSPSYLPGSITPSPVPFYMRWLPYNDRNSSSPTHPASSPRSPRPFASVKFPGDQVGSSSDTSDKTSPLSPSKVLNQLFPIPQCNPQSEPSPPPDPDLTTSHHNETYNLTFSPNPALSPDSQVKYAFPHFSFKMFLTNPSKKAWAPCLSRDLLICQSSIFRYFLLAFTFLPLFRFRLHVTAPFLSTVSH
jgi:hypothetical protein